MTKSFDMSPAVCRRPLTLSISALFSSLVVPKHLWALEKRPVTGTVLNWSSWRNYLATEILRLSEEDKHSPLHRAVTVVQHSRSWCCIDAISLKLTQLMVPRNMAGFLAI
ncbi:uncharacterized protein LOC144006777 isoform X2 [Festucalex cinctus]